jgi:hypothetical protein
VFASEHFCSEANIIACFCYTKLYLHKPAESFDSATSAADPFEARLNGSSKELDTGTLRGS